MTLNRAIRELDKVFDDIMEAKGYGDGWPTDEQLDEVGATKVVVNSRPGGNLMKGAYYDSVNNEVVIE